LLSLIADYQVWLNKPSMFLLDKPQVSVLSLIAEYHAWRIEKAESPDAEGHL